MHVYHVHAWCLPRSEEGIKNSETGITSCFEPPYAYWNQNSGALQEKHVLLNTKLSIQIAKSTFQNGVGNLLKWQFILILRYCFKELPHTSF